MTLAYNTCLTNTLSPPILITLRNAPALQWASWDLKHRRGGFRPWLSVFISLGLREPLWDEKHSILKMEESRTSANLSSWLQFISMLCHALNNEAVNHAWKSSSSGHWGGPPPLRDSAPEDSDPTLLPSAPHPGSKNGRGCRSLVLVGRANMGHLVNSVSLPHFAEGKVLWSYPIFLTSVVDWIGWVTLR